MGGRIAKPPCAQLFPLHRADIRLSFILRGLPFSVGISLFGRDTPEYILEEVGRRQLAERGTSSLWAKLAADYGPRHANFIIKHDTKFPITRNDRNSWSNIAQAFTDKTRIRPVSAPITRREVKTELSDTTGVNNRGNAKDRAVTARGRLADANPNGGSAPLFQRTEEIQAVVSLLQESKVPRLKGKLKKGERKKAAKAAEEAKRISSVLSSVVGSSAVDRESNKDLLEQRSQSSMPTAISSSTADSGPRTTFAEHRGRRRRPKSASHSGIPTNARRGSTGRPPAPKVRSRRAPSTTALSSPEHKRPRSAGSSFKHRQPAEPDSALGLMKPRTRIYSFGAAGIAATEGGGGRHREGVPPTAATDAGRHVCSDRGHDTAGATASRSGRGRERGKDDGGAGSSGNFGLVTGDESRGDTGASAHAEADNHLGAIDLSKLTTVLSHVEVCGFTGAKVSVTKPGNMPGGGGGGEARVGFRRGSGRADDFLARRGSDGGATVRGRIGDGGEAAPLVPETDASEDSGTETDEGDNQGQEEEEEGGGGGSILEPSVREPRIAELGGGSSTEGAAGAAFAGAARGPEGVAPDPPGTSRGGVPPYLGCSRGRYARAESKSKSAYAARRAAAAAAGARPAAEAVPHTSASLRTASVPTSRDGRGGSGAGSGASKAPAEEGREGGGRGAATASSWRGKFAAVQRRRGKLEESMRAEAKRLVETRAKKQARASYNASVSMSVSVRGAKRFLGLRGRASERATETTRPPTKREVRAARMIQRAFRNTRQHQLWLGDKCDRDYVSKVALDQAGAEGDEPDAPHQGDQRLSPSGGVDLFSSRYGPAAIAEEGATYRAKKLHDRHVAVRTKRMVRGFICCTQARVLLLQLLWDKIEGSILGERRSKRAAAESRAAATIQQLSHIRRIAVGLIKIQSSAKAFKLEHQSKQAKRNPMAKPAAGRRQGARNQAGGERTFETAKQARSEKAECDAILREHGRRGRRLVPTTVRDRVLRDMLYAYRRQHIIRDQTEYLLETSRPPFVDSRDIKRMLACPAEEMHKFSDPKNYRTRPRFTRLALPLREIEGMIQDVIASHVKSEYRDKLKEALGTSPATAATTRVSAQQQQEGQEKGAQKTVRGNDRRSSSNNNGSARPASVQGLSGAIAPTAAPAASMADRLAVNRAADTVHSPLTATASATKTASEDWGVRRRRGGVAKVMQMTATSGTAAAAV